jgi:hypothetical protein
MRAANRIQKDQKKGLTEGVSTYASRCKAEPGFPMRPAAWGGWAAEKSWRRTLRETSEAQPVFGQTHANRDRGWSARFRKLGEYGHGDRPPRLTLENGNGVASTGRHTTTLILAVMAMPGPRRDGCICGPVPAPSRNDPRIALPNALPRPAASTSSAQTETTRLSAFLCQSAVLERRGLNLADVDAMVIETGPSEASRSGRAKWPPPPFASAIEAVWRKRAVGVVPAQPKARPVGRRRNACW